MVRSDRRINRTRVMFVIYHRPNKSSTQSFVCKSAVFATHFVLNNIPLPIAVVGNSNYVDVRLTIMQQ